MTCYSIGYMREDGSFAILATLNNNDSIINNDNFNDVSKRLKFDLEMLFNSTAWNSTDFFTTIEIRERQDAPDYVDL